MARHPSECNRDREIDLEHLLLLYEQRICRCAHTVHRRGASVCSAVLYPCESPNILTAIMWKVKVKSLILKSPSILIVKH